MMTPNTNPTAPSGSRIHSGIGLSNYGASTVANDENPAIDVPPEHAIKDISARREAKYDDPDQVAKADD